MTDDEDPAIPTRSEPPTAPDVIVPAHCTGWRAQLRIGTALADAFVHNTVGTSFVLAAARARAALPIAPSGGTPPRLLSWSE